MMTEPATVQSPFLPNSNIQFAWDSTCIGYLKACPRLYQYVILEGWQPKGESVHLRFGSEYHEAIQDYEIAKAEGETHTDAICTALKSLLCRTRDWDVDESSKAGNYKNRSTLTQLIIDYFDHYADDPAETLILENGKPAVELSFSFSLDWGPKAAGGTKCDSKKSIDGGFGSEQIECDGVFKDGDLIGGCGEPCNFCMHPDDGIPIDSPQPYLLSGHLDRVVTLNDSIFVLDHKTTTTTPSQYFFNGFNPSNQMTLYTLAGRVVLDTPIRGVIVEAAQIMLDKPSRFVREPTHRTQDQLDEWVNDLRYWFSLAEQYAEAGHWPMNDTSCSMYGGCKFKEVCAKSPQVREIYLKSDFIKLEPEQRWNPLKPR